MVVPESAETLVAAVAEQGRLKKIASFSKLALIAQALDHLTKNVRGVGDQLVGAAKRPQSVRPLPNAQGEQPETAPVCWIAGVKLRGPAKVAQGLAPIAGVVAFDGP